MCASRVSTRWAGVAIQPLRATAVPISLDSNVNTGRHRKFVQNAPQSIVSHLHEEDRLPGGVEESKNKSEGQQLFVIFSLAYSGTTWTLSMLNSNKYVRCHTEPLMEAVPVPPDVVKDRLQRFRLTPLNSQGVETLLTENFWKWDIPSGSLRDCQRHRCARGFKFFNGEGGIHLESLPRCSASDTSSNQARCEVTKWFVSYLRNNSFKIILLERLGIEPYLANQRHRATGRFVCKSVACVAEQRKARYTIDTKNMLRALHDRSTVWDAVKTWVQAEFPSHMWLHLTYNDLISDPTREVQRIFKLLDVEFNHIATDLTQKMANRDPLEAVKNAGDVRKVLNGTKWAILG